MKIMIIDDNEPMAEMTKNHLAQKFSGAQLALFNDCMDAMEKKEFFRM
jgi:hypothetical protein